MQSTWGKRLRVSVTSNSSLLSSFFRLFILVWYFLLIVDRCDTCLLGLGIVIIFYAARIDRKKRNVMRNTAWNTVWRQRVTRRTTIALCVSEATEEMTEVTERFSVKTSSYANNEVPLVIFWANFHNNNVTFFHFLLNTRVCVFFLEIMVIYSYGKYAVTTKLMRILP